MSIGLTTVLLFAVFGLLLFLSCPISVSIVIASIVTAMSTLSWDQITFITMQKMNSGVESFSLLAIPLFILAGNIMNNGGIARRLVNFSKLFVGWIPGSLAQANIVGNMLFGALSGSSVAAASAMGGCIYPIQKDEGYDPAFATAVNIASAPTGLLIPPTSAFIVYSTVAGGVSISTLFMAGYVPGILMGLGSMAVAFIYAKKHKYPTSGKTPAKEALKVTLEAIPSLLLIVIVIGGIVGGIFTATEGAGICVLYCLILSICYRSITVKSFTKILVNSACTSGIILFLISASSCHVLCHGILRNPCCHLHRPHVHLHEQICDLPADEHHPHGSRYVHGHHACNPDLYTNLPSDRTESRNDRYPVWRYADLQHVPWKHYTACRLCSVRRLWNQQDQYRRSNKNSASLFCSPVPSVISSYLYPALSLGIPTLMGLI